MRDLKALCPKWAISIRSLPLGLREKEAKYKSKKGWGTPRKQGPIDTHMNSETEAACMDLHRSGEDVDTSP